MLCYLNYWKEKTQTQSKSKKVVDKMSEENKKIEDELLRKATGGESVVEGDYIVLKGYGKDGKYHEIRFANNYSGYQQMQQMAARLGIET